MYVRMVKWICLAYSFGSVTTFKVDQTLLSYGRLRGLSVIPRSGNATTVGGNLSMIPRPV